METVTIDLPAMYGDHHVLEVRQLLLKLPGVTDVYASSSFQVAEVTFDPAQTGEEAFTTVLEKAGYLGDLNIPQETGALATEREGVFFRHSTAFQGVGTTMSFEQEISNNGRALWPCPGIGPLSKMKD